MPGVTAASEGSASMGAAAWTSVAIALVMMVALFFVLPVAFVLYRVLLIPAPR